MCRDSGMPAKAITSDTPKKNVALVPITRLACAVSFVPIACPTRMVAAMPTPNTAPIRKNMMLLAFAVAVSASSPRKRPTQIALTEPFSDCRTLPPRIGNANTNSVRPIGPRVRSRVLAFGIAASCQKPDASPFHGNAQRDSGKLGSCEIVQPGEHRNHEARHLALGSAVLPDPQPGEAGGRDGQGRGRRPTRQGLAQRARGRRAADRARRGNLRGRGRRDRREARDGDGGAHAVRRVRSLARSEEHTSELQSLMRTSYAVFS